MNDPMLPPGTNYCKCPTCNEYFGGVRGFDLHRDGEYPNRVCLAPSGLRDKHGNALLKKNKRGYWVRCDQPLKK